MKLLKTLFKQKERPEWVKGLKSGDIAIDCGANVGKITTTLAETGATVYAFEPNPHAFQKLRENTARFKNVVCLQKAVSDAPGTVSLFMHENAGQDPVYWST